MRLPSKETVDRLRKQYPEGTRVELISMEDPYTSLRPGERGSVSFVDDTGTLHCAWDSGSHLGVVYGVDQVKRIENEIKYETGADFWRDTASHHGQEEAFGICGRYLKAQLKTEKREEKQFCRELFAAVTEAAAGRTDPAKIVYPYPFEKADERSEASHYHNSRTANNECAVTIDTAIRESCYATNYYNLDIAAIATAHDYGFERVKAVLAHYIHEHEYDGRFSHANKKWAASFDLPEAAFERAILNAHPILIDGFADRFRRLYMELDALSYALPGTPEAGHIVQGYEIMRSVWFDDRRGFAIGHNPDAGAPFVCWQFTTENGKRDFYWGTYENYQVDAQSNYLARVAVHMKDEPVKEIPNPLAAAEMSAEQNYNMIDGRINNEKSRLDLTDGQTYEEIRELAPETLHQEKPSVLKQIREAKKEPKKPAPKKHKEKGAPDLER